jgi:molecular chaperone DnaK
MGDTVDTAARTEIESAIAAVRESLTSEDPAEIQARTQALQEAFHRVSEQMYAAAAQAGAAGAGPDGAAGPEGAASTDGASADEEEVVDAEVVEGEGR